MNYKLERGQINVCHRSSFAIIGYREAYTLRRNFDIEKMYPFLFRANLTLTKKTDSKKP